jgi:type II secretory pathway component PulK
MHAIFIVLLLAALAVGIAVGVLLTIIHYQAVEARQHADQAKLAEVEELYAAWAALRARTRRPPV